MKLYHGMVFLKFLILVFIANIESGIFLASNGIRIVENYNS
jgi:hypothetical protein